MIITCPQNRLSHLFQCNDLCFRPAFLAGTGVARPPPPPPPQSQRPPSSVPSSHGMMMSPPPPQRSENRYVVYHTLPQISELHFSVLHLTSYLTNSYIISLLSVSKQQKN